MNSGAVMSSSVDYHQMGRHTPNHHPSLDWSTDYHGNGCVLTLHELQVFKKKPNTRQTCCCLQ